MNRELKNIKFVIAIIAGIVSLIFNSAQFIRPLNKFMHLWVGTEYVIIFIGVLGVISSVRALESLKTNLRIVAIFTFMISSYTLLRFVYVFVGWGLALLVWSLDYVY